MPAPSAFDASFRRRLGAEHLIGVDEAGRGPLAGPVVCAAVRLGRAQASILKQARDSKRLSAAQREKIFPLILKNALNVSVAWAHPRSIERDNILAATLSAMRRCVGRIPGQAPVLVDGNRAIPNLKRRQITIVGGDGLSLAIACASIVAKVLRDRYLQGLDRRYPGYGLAKHKGYGTAEHLSALRRLGPSPTHRRTYAPVARMMAIMGTPYLIQFSNQKSELSRVSP